MNCLQWWLVAGPWTQRRGPSFSSLFSVSQSFTQRWALTCEKSSFFCLLFYFFPSNTKGWWTLFMRNTCMKMCLIRWADSILMILFCTVPLEFLYSWITFLQHSQVKGFFFCSCALKASRNGNDRAHPLPRGWKQWKDICTAHQRLWTFMCHLTQFPKLLTTWFYRQYFLQFF